MDVSGAGGAVAGPVKFKSSPVQHAIQAETLTVDVTQLAATVDVDRCVSVDPAGPGPAGPVDIAARVDVDRYIVRGCSPVRAAEGVGIQKRVVDVQDNRVPAVSKPQLVGLGRCVDRHRRIHGDGRIVPDPRRLVTAPVQPRSPVAVAGITVPDQLPKQGGARKNRKDITECCSFI